MRHGWGCVADHADRLRNRDRSRPGRRRTRIRAPVRLLSGLRISDLFRRAVAISPSRSFASTRERTGADARAAAKSGAKSKVSEFSMLNPPERIDPVEGITKQAAPRVSRLDGSRAKVGVCGRCKTASSAKAPRTRSISANGSSGGRSPRQATCRSGRESRQLARIEFSRVVRIHVQHASARRDAPPPRRGRRSRPPD